MVASWTWMSGMKTLVERSQPRKVCILTCEVNEDPPNPDSMQFHKKLGFRELGKQKTEDGKKSVVILGRDL